MSNLKRRGSGDSPKGFFAWAAKYAPETVSLAVGALALLTVSIFGLKSGFSIYQLSLAAILVVLLGVVGAVLSRLAVGTNQSMIGGAFAWAIALLFVTILVLFITSAFTNIFPQGTALVARVLQLPGLIPISDRLTPVDGRMRFDQLGHLADPISVGDDPIARVQALAARGRLEIRGGGVLALSNRQEARTLAVHTLVLGDGTILINDGNLTIEVVDLISNNGRIAAFEAPSQGRPGEPGRNGGSVRLLVRGKMSGELTVLLSGEKGSDGAVGRPGAAGPPGREGDNAASGAFDCRRGAGSGGNGGPGLPGEPGSPGLTGGNGGNLLAAAQDPVTMRNLIRFHAAGGQGGAGGPGGVGGRGGPGGAGGGPRGLCSGSGPRGADGPPGPPGSAGSPGSTGNDGTISIGTLAVGG